MIHNRSIKIHTDKHENPNLLWFKIFAGYPCNPIRKCTAKYDKYFNLQYVQQEVTAGMISVVFLPPPVYYRTNFFNRQAHK